MKKKYYDMPVKVFLKEFGQEGKIASTLASSLARAGYNFVRDILASTPKQIAEVENIGITSFEMLMTAIGKAGLEFGVVEVDENEDGMYKMAVGYLRSLGYEVILVKGSARIA